MFLIIIHLYFFITGYFCTKLAIICIIILKLRINTFFRSSSFEHFISHVEGKRPGSDEKVQYPCRNVINSFLLRYGVTIVCLSIIKSIPFADKYLCPCKTWLCCCILKAFVKILNLIFLNNPVLRKKRKSITFSALFMSAHVTYTWVYCRFVFQKQHWNTYVIALFLSYLGETLVLWLRN